MVVERTRMSRRDSTPSARTARIARRVAAVAGAAGAAVGGEAEAVGLTYVPTPGVVTAQGIPGLSFTPPTTVTSGTLRPPASAGGNAWDVDGNGTVDFELVNFNGLLAALNPLALFTANPNAMLVVDDSVHPLLNLTGGANVGPAANLWYAGGQPMTYNQGLNQTYFTLNNVGYFGFRFASSNSASEYYYGWASLTIDALATGRGFKIGEAFYQSTPNTGINVGAVPVPEPSSMALLATGAAGVTAWRARRKKQPAAE